MPSNGLLVPFLLFSLNAVGGLPTYRVDGPAGPGGWKLLFDGLNVRSVSVDEDVLVLRPNASFPQRLRERIEAGLLVVVEANPEVAARFGVEVRSGPLVRREVDARAIDKVIVWAQEVRALEAKLPADAAVFSRDRWSNVPLMAGWKLGRGAVLWLAVPMPENAYDRLTFLPQALTSLGLDLPLTTRRTWAFFDYAYRSRTDPEYMARQWRQMGISALHAAAWYHFEPDASRDAFLRRLIEACHRNGILVFAWLEYPHVSDQFWADNPQWRDKTAQLTDAAVFWRKLMNFQNRDCVAAVKKGTDALLARFDWDGVNLAELYFESLLGPDDPAQFTPMNADFRALYRTRFGYDPVSIFEPASPNYWKVNGTALRQLYDIRADLNYEMHDEWLTYLSRLRTPRSGDPYALAVTNVDDLYDPRIRDFLGYDARRLLKALDRLSFTFIVQDPAVLWHLGPERYPRIAELYGQLTSQRDSLAIDVNVARRQDIAYPTERQAGTEMMRLARATNNSFPLVMYYSEFSITRPDRPLLPSASAVAELATEAGGLRVKSPYGVGVTWSGPANVNGQAWPFQNDAYVWLPAGEFVITPRSDKPAMRLTDFNGAIRAVEEKNGIVSLIYKTTARAIAVVDKRPAVIWIDGKESAPEMLTRRDGGVAILLPAGEHWVSLAPPA